MTDTRNDPIIGSRFGAYIAERRTGEGSMGVVYQGYHHDLGQQAAIKLLKPRYSPERFTREARTLARLDHPNIVRILGFGQTHEGLNYLVMSWLPHTFREQQSLDERWSLDEIVSILNKLASALDYAHRRNIVHRDVKASNIMFDEKREPILVDFGIASMLDVKSNLTKDSAMLGTYSHKAPETWAGQPFGPSADQYALAVTVYEMLTGNLPFVPADSADVLSFAQLHATRWPDAPHTIRPELPNAASMVLRRALSKNPDGRYPSIAQFAAAFEAAVNELPSSVPTLLRKPHPIEETLPRNPLREAASFESNDALPNPQRRRRVVILLLILVLTLFPFVIGFLIASEQRTTNTPEQLQTATAAALFDMSTHVVRSLTALADTKPAATTHP